MGIDVHDLCLNCFKRHLAVMEARSYLRVSHQCDTTLSNCCQRGGAVVESAVQVFFLQ